jgi:hypothetical protein
VVILDVADPESPKIVANLPLKNSVVGPLKVTSCGLSFAILWQKAVMSSFSVLSPTWGAPTASTAQ